MYWIKPLEGQTYLLDHRCDEKFGELLGMLNEITVDMRNGKMNIEDLHNQVHGQNTTSRS